MALEGDRCLCVCECVSWFTRSLVLLQCTVDVVNGQSIAKPLTTTLWHSTGTLLSGRCLLVVVVVVVVVVLLRIYAAAWSPQPMPGKLGPVHDTLLQDKHRHVRVHARYREHHHEELEWEHFQMLFVDFICITILLNVVKWTKRERKRKSEW